MSTFYHVRAIRLGGMVFLSRRRSVPPHHLGFRVTSARSLPQAPVWVYGKARGGLLSLSVELSLCDLALLTGGSWGYMGLRSPRSLSPTTPTFLAAVFQAHRSSFGFSLFQGVLLLLLRARPLLTFLVRAGRSTLVTAGEPPFILISLALSLVRRPWLCRPRPIMEYT